MVGHLSQLQMRRIRTSGDNHWHLRGSVVIDGGGACDVGVVIAEASMLSRVHH